MISAVALDMLAANEIGRESALLSAPANVREKVLSRLKQVHFALGPPRRLCCQRMILLNKTDRLSLLRG